MSADADTGYSPSELRAMSPERLFRVGETTFQQLLALAGKDANAMHPDRMFRLGDPVVQGLLDAAERKHKPAQAKPEKKTEAPAPTPEPAAPTATAPKSLNPPAANPEAVNPEAVNPEAEARAATPAVEAPLSERVTIDGLNVVVEHTHSPIENKGIEAGGERFKLLNVLDPKFRPENYKKADGAPLRLFDAAGVKVDLSKRSHEDMGFWHRNVDFHEIIFCFKGALRWETEMGTVILKEGDMMVIPKGITHRSALCEESADENILLELKVRDELVYVGDDH